MERNCSEREYLYWMTQIPVLGAVKIERIWDMTGSFESAFNIEGKHLKEAGILSEKEEDCYDFWKKNLDDCRKTYNSLSEKGIQFITPLDDFYPSRLLQIYGKPMGLYVKGSLPNEDEPTAAIIGARNCSSYGQQIAEYMGSALSRAGIQIISGLALGIDGAGHLGALREGKKTYGIIGSGINICYPRENYPLFEKMKEQGGIITECLMGEQPIARNFPMRNRIISGLSDVIIVIEAKEKSGSLITVGHGLDQGKEVFALPGRVTDQLSRGCNQLIRDGANILNSPEDVIAYFGIKNDKMLRVDEKNTKGLVKTEKIVYSCLDLQPKFIEQIAAESGLAVNQCISILLELELSGYILETASHYYVKKL